MLTTIASLGCSVGLCVASAAFQVLAERLRLLRASRDPDAPPDTSDQARWLALLRRSLQHEGLADAIEKVRRTNGWLVPVMSE